MRISTIIPAYNRADLIGETLRSVLSQTRPPHEVIVVDDGSTDGTADAVAAFGNEVQLICRGSNSGPAAARNQGFSRATGEIIHFMDSDDISALGTYESGAKFIEKGATIVYGPWLKTKINGRNLSAEPFVLQQKPVPVKFSMRHSVLVTDWMAVLQSCLFLRSLIESSGPFREDLMPSDDLEMFYRVVCRAGRAAYSPDMLLLYRVHPEHQVSTQNLPARRVDQANLWTVLQQHAAAAADLDRATRRRFRRKKYDVACDVRRHDPALADALAGDVTILDRAFRQPRKLARRVGGRLRVATTGNPYPPVFAAAPLRADQRKQIRALGYTLAEPDR